MARADLKPSLTIGRGVNQTPELIASYSYSREFTQRRRRRQRERQKSTGFRPAKQQLCTCITLFCTFLCRRCTTTTWNCLISRFVEDWNKRQLLSFLFLNFDALSPLEFNFKKVWRIKRDGISAIKFEAAQIHFLSDVFVAVAVVVVVV